MRGTPEARAARWTYRPSLKGAVGAAKNCDDMATPAKKSAKRKPEPAEGDDGYDRDDGKHGALDGRKYVKMEEAVKEEEDPLPPLPPLPEIDVDALPPPVSEPPDIGMDLSVCPSCEEEHSVWWDDVDGWYLCHNCGWGVEPVGEGGEVVVVPADDVNGYDDVVHETMFDPSGQVYGTIYVGADDTGARVAMNTMASPGGGQVVQRNQGYGGVARVKKLIDEYGNRLNLTAPVVNEAKAYGAHIYDTLESRTMKLELMALSGLYIAIRMNGLPKTLVDIISSIPRGNETVYSVGKAYRRSLDRLKQAPPHGPGLRLEVPRTHAKVLVPKVFAMLLAKYDVLDEYDGSIGGVGGAGSVGELDRRTRDAIHRDANELVDYIERMEPRAQHPLTLAATAVYLAISMNRLPKPTLDVVTRAVGISETALKTKANFVKNSMAELGQVLAYGKNITPRNAMNYACVILRLSKLKRRDAVAALETRGETRKRIVGDVSMAMAGEETIEDDADVYAEGIIDKLVNDYGGELDAGVADGADDRDDVGDEDEDEDEDDEDLEEIDVDEYLLTQEEVDERQVMRRDLENMASP